MLTTPPTDQLVRPAEQELATLKTLRAISQYLVRMTGANAAD